MPATKSTAAAPTTPVPNSQNPATWLKPDEPLIGADGRDWSWCYVWHKDIEGFPAYKVGADGSVWTCHVPGSRTGRLSSTWRKLKPKESGYHGHVAVHLCHEGNVRREYVHRLVLEVFVGVCPAGLEGCHFPDRNPTNNSLSNLKWGTSEENSSHMVIHGTRACGESHYAAELSDEEIREIRAEWAAGDNYSEIAERHGLTRKYVHKLVSGGCRIDAGGPMRQRVSYVRPEFGPHNPPHGVKYAELAEFPGYMIGSDETMWSKRSRSGRMGDEWRPIRVVSRSQNGRSVAITKPDGMRSTLSVSVLTKRIFGDPIVPCGAQAAEVPAFGR